MPSGLAPGARILRKCRNSNRIGAIHPWRRALVWLLFLPLFVGLFVLNMIGQFGTWISNLEDWTENCADWWRDFVESWREIEIHRRAYRRANKEEEGHA